MKTHIEFDTTPYERSHMKEPRGRGSWAFSFEPNPRDVVKDVTFTPGGMTYAEAKKWMREWLVREQTEGRVGAAHYVVLYAQP